MRLTEVVGQLNLDDRIKMKYTELANLFESDIRKNITRSHFDLEEHTVFPTTNGQSSLQLPRLLGGLTTRCDKSVEQGSDDSLMRWVEAM